MRVATLALFLLALAGCASPSTAPITADEIHEHVRFLADDRLEGRATGSDGCREAADYIAARFADAGLEPGGQYGTYFQHFTATAGSRLTDDTTFEIEGHTFQRGQDYAVGGGIGQGDGLGTLVFAGYGIEAPELEHDDYADLEVRGKVVVVLAGAPGRAEGKGEFLDTRPAGAKAQPRAKYAAAFRHQAAGMIYILEAGQDLPEYSSGRGEGLSLPAVHVTSAVGARLLADAGVSLEQARRAAEAGEPGSSALSARQARVRVATEPIQRPTANVIGILPGQGKRADEVIVVGAHYDHLGHGDSSSLGGRGLIHNGADDNASGVAAVLEIAQACAARPLPRTLVFIAFSGEEIGLLGSAHYVRFPVRPIEQTVAMVNLDMIGRSKDGYCAVGPVACSPDFDGLPEQLCASLHLDLKVDTKDGAVNFGSSDHSSFLNVGVPSMALFSGLHEDYHRPSDDADKINAEGAAQITRLTQALVSELARRAERPEFKPLPAPRRKSLAQRSQDRPWFGSIPAFGDDGGQGVLFQGVMPDSPAEKAGLQGGDRLVEIDGQTIDTLEDFVTVLRAHAVGDDLAVVVLRNGQPFRVQLTLAVRGE